MVVCLGEIYFAPLTDTVPNPESVAEEALVDAHARLALDPREIVEGFTDIAHDGFSEEVDATRTSVKQFALPPCPET